MKAWIIWGFLASSVSFASGLAAQERDAEVRLVGGDESVTASFTGDDVRVSVGIDDDGDVHGEYFHVFGENERAAWIAELWGAEDRGGAKLNYHWLSGASSFKDAIAKDDVSIRKAFVAVDQNEFDDRKITTGFGSEGPRLFWGAYVNANLSGQRLVDEQVVTDFETITFVDSGQVFEQTRIIDNITRFFEAPYDYGVGVRLGRFFDHKLLRVRGGLDLEQGRSDTDQVTASVGLEKYFENTGHSLALTAEYLDKSGDFEVDDSDLRALLLYRYSFGERYRPRRDHVERRVEVPESEREPVTRIEKRPVQNRVEITDEAYFDFDKSNIRPDAAGVLEEVVSEIRTKEIVGPILVIGHTCNIGTEEYNQGLSERRAKSAVNFLVDQGLDRGGIRWEARGELDPKYSNEQESTRKFNRRVELEFVSLESGIEEVEVTVEDSDAGRVKWVREPIKDPAWMDRALRNPIQHKRTVDTYRFAVTERQETTTPPVVVNNLPVAGDDAAVTNRDTPVTIVVLANDSDPDGESLRVVTVTAPANGDASINADDTVTYTPAAGFAGEDQFSYTVADTEGGEATANVTVTVVEVPPTVASDDSAQTSRNQAVTIDVLANDQGEGLTISQVGSPANGSASVDGNRIVYQPARDFVGSDAFTYTVEGDNGSDQATVTVEVLAANQSPIARDDSATTPQSVPVRIDVLANDSDPDGDTLTIISVNPEVTQYGTVQITSDNQILYSPNPAWFGDDEFQYTISDGFGGEATATVTLDVLK